MSASGFTVEPAVPEQRLLGESAAMRSVRVQVAKISSTPSNVLITGESGTGKEIVARALHAASPRHAQAFVPTNCGAIPEALLESQLFGHVRGAFTTAVQASPGLFAAADRGTIYLDEIGDLPLHMQVKLLRVIEEKNVWAVGSTKPVLIDARIIASTNRDLVKEIEGGRFREALSVLMNHPWKGNVRELEHVLESAMILGEGEVIALPDLPDYLVTATGEMAASDALRDVTRRFERQHIMAVLTQTQFDKKEAARRLGISLASLYRKIGEHAIQANDTEAPAEQALLNLAKPP